MTAPRPSVSQAGLGLRLLRAAVFTAACVALSAAGHGLASASPTALRAWEAPPTVPLWTLATGFVALLIVAVPLAGRPRSLTGIAAVLAVGQIALHTLFSLGQHDMTMPHSDAETSLMTHAAHMMSGAEAAGGASHALKAVGEAGVGHGGMMSSAGSMGSGTGAGEHAARFADGSHPLLHALPMLPSLPMLLGHVLAAVVAGWLLRRGDLAVFRLVALSAEITLVRALRAALALATLRLARSGARRTGPRPPRGTTAEPLPPQQAALQHTVIRRGPPIASACVLAA